MDRRYMVRQGLPRFMSGWWRQQVCDAGVTERGKVVALMRKEHRGSVAGRRALARLAAWVNSFYRRLKTAISL